MTNETDLPVVTPNVIPLVTGDVTGFWQARKDFLAHLRYTRGHSERTCYNYHSDLGIWGRWLEENGKDWRNVSHVNVEQFSGWLMRERGVKAHIVARRSSCLGSFYKWAIKNSLVDRDPVYLADKPKRPHRIPVWLEKEEQQALQKATRNIDDLPKNIFGRARPLRLPVRPHPKLGLTHHRGPLGACA